MDWRSARAGLRRVPDEPRRARRRHARNRRAVAPHHYGGQHDAGRSADCPGRRRAPVPPHGHARRRQWHCGPALGRRLRPAAADHAAIPLGGPLGVWRGQTFPPPGDPAWLTTATLPDTAPAPQLERRDGTLAWRDVNAALQGAGPQAALWRATLHTTAAGDYVFDVATDARVTLWIDGRLIGGRQAGPAPLPITAALTSGDHAIEARVITQPQAGPVFELYGSRRGTIASCCHPPRWRRPPGAPGPRPSAPACPRPIPALLAAALPALRVQSGAIIRGPWLEARGVAALPDGGLVVGDTGHSRVHVYRPDGSEAAAWGAPGAGDGLFKTITHVAVSGDGVIATLDTGNHEIQLFDERGAFIRRLPATQIGISEAMGIAWGPDGKIYVADTSGSRVVRLAPRWRARGQSARSGGPAGPAGAAHRCGRDARRYALRGGPTQARGALQRRRAASTAPGPYPSASTEAARTWPFGAATSSSRPPRAIASPRSTRSPGLCAPCNRPPPPRSTSPCRLASPRARITGSGC